ncbi:(2Fe-2S) ferredoxin domain-containing protein [Spirochaeta lutea]|uniref:NAD(P)-dependent iron-only hydrogenase iron-sulfur protein n=1 Tax=Spirochaeta lutea TaxID=1480694 RepID=A0A098R0T2_9SPIO|nr:(2Fe-2S) ferredoxin domain-containing protein [Spirochaeta lutea]KGE73336.1 NAD(P)-dependent iron-only hydrogenase iron-sulfur protein [Spirochaeta lutea]
MAKLNLEALRKLREENKQALEIRDTENKTIQIIIGMGTSGIAAGAKQTLKAFTDLLRERNLTQVSLRQAGSIGLDHAEPVVEVRMPGMPDIIYGKVDPKVAEQIIEQHIIGKELLNEHVFDRPARDIVQD